jgi:cyclophilin family peptidyl-prolyl cis-trans isomerase
MRRRIATAVMLAVALGVAPAALSARQAASPVIVIETAKGTIEIELFPADAPKSVEHILALVKKNFYRGQRIHRVTAGLVQFGDPGTRDMSRRAYWGNGNSGTPIGVAEISRKLTQVRGVVGLAHSGTPEYADSQLYILKAASPNLNGKHAIIGRVTKGMDVVDKLQVADLIRRIYVKGAGDS